MGANIGGHLVAEELYRHGVRDIFTLCGGHIAPIYDGCLRYGIRLIDTRHEQAAAHAGDGYARLTRGVGVALVTAGPGVTDAVTGIANAFQAQAPLVVLGGAAEVRSVHRGALQEMEQIPLMRTITKWCATVNDPKRLREYIQSAIRIATGGVPGPVFLELPFDVLMAQVDDNELIVPPPLPPWPRMQADPAQVEQLVAGAPGNPNAIIRGVAFSLQPGEVLAVVGPSASGKTTLARLLVGLWPAAAGKVRLDGADVFSWDKSELGPHVGYLPQGVELFDGTVAENIARFGPVEKAKVESAARAVGLHEFILALPQGYDTEVGRDGAILSGGQRQRMALARALYGDPVYVVLDEPNSSLDEAGDAALAAALLELKARGTTFVVMTHRTSVLAVADKMLVLRDGMQQAFGPRDDVLAAIRKASEQAAQQAAQQVAGLAAPQA